MTDRIKALTVILERDNRDDDVQQLVNAIMLFRGVSSVQMQKVTSEDHIARIKARTEIEKQLWDALNPKET